MMCWSVMYAPAGAFDAVRSAGDDRNLFVQIDFNFNLPVSEYKDERQ